MAGKKSALGGSGGEESPLIRGAESTPIGDLYSVQLILELCIRALLGIVAILLSPVGPWTGPVIREIDPQNLHLYSFPALRQESIPIESIFIACFGMMLLVFAITHLVLYLHPQLHSRYRPLKLVNDALNYTLATSLAFLVLYVSVECLKVWVGRPRPDFLARCYPQGYEIPALPQKPICTKSFDTHELSDGLKSFPSGHSAAGWCASTLAYLYVREKMLLLSNHKHSRIPKSLPFVVGCCFAALATYIACTRIWDHMHHVEDVIAGGLIGVTIAYLVFNLYYPLKRVPLIDGDDGLEVTQGKVVAQEASDFDYGSFGA